MSRISGMIPKAITAQHRWWTKDPWTAFGGITLFGLLFIIIRLSYDFPGFVDLICLLVFLVLVIAWFLSCCRGVFITWQRSKVEGVLAVVASAIISLIIISTIPTFALHYRPFSYYDSDVKSNLRNAATAQEAYFVDHDTYTTNIGSLKVVGYRQSSNVTITASATKTTYVITGTITEGCKANSGTWSITSTWSSNSMNESISGTPCGKSWSDRLRSFFWWAFLRCFCPKPFTLLPRLHR